MRNCPKCNNVVQDGAAFCPVCGTSFQQQAYQQGYAPTAPMVNQYDHTGEFDPKDISHNKVMAMLCYLGGLFGVLIAVIAAQKSDYTMFHVRQTLKFVVFETLLAIAVLVASIVLCWTIFIPLVLGIGYGIFSMVLWVIKVIAVFQIGSGKACEPAIIRGVGFLK